MGQIVLVPPNKWQVAIIIPANVALLKGSLSFLMEATAIALSFQRGQVCEISIEDLHTHGVLADGHLDGLLQATHHIRCLPICSKTNVYLELVELYAVFKRHPVL